MRMEWKKFKLNNYWNCYELRGRSIEEWKRLLQLVDHKTGKFSIEKKFYDSKIKNDKKKDSIKLHHTYINIQKKKNGSE